MNSTPNWQTNFTEFWKGRGKIQQLGELTAVQHMQAIAKDNQRNIEAESAAVRRKLWGSDESKATESDDMGNTILGDVTNPAPIVINQPAPQQSNLLPIALAALAGLGIPTAMVGGAAAMYLLNKPAATQPQPQTYQDETVSIGLGRIDDYTGAAEK
jgi:hypothetical protein